VSFRNLDNPPSGMVSSNPSAIASMLGAVLGWLAKVQGVVNNIMRGKINATVDVNLTASAASTTVNDPRIGGSCGIYLMPLSANAAAEIGAGTIWWGAPGNQTVTLNHANSAQTDRRFRLLIIG
jgi:hypothetical protein